MRSGCDSGEGQDVVAHWAALRMKECVRTYNRYFGEKSWVDKSCRRPKLGETRAWVDALLRLGRGNEAIRRLEEYVAREPAQPVYWELLGFAALHRDPERAAFALEEAWRCGRRAACVFWWWVEAREKAGRSPRLSELGDVDAVLGNVGSRTADGWLLWAFLHEPDRERALMAGWNAHLRSIGESEVGCEVAQGGGMFDGLRTRGRTVCRSGGTGPLVSLIVTARNEEAGLGAACRSLLGQSYPNFELILVDDGSVDGTPGLMRQFAALDSRIRFLRLEHNAGIFAAKNIALDYVRGDFVGFFDGDDWAHPSLLERKVRVLNDDPKAVAVLTKRVRVTPEWRFDVRRPGRVVHEDPASLLCRREVFADLGCYDWVRTSADSELLRRIGRAYGETKIVRLDAWLSLALWVPTSLSGPQGLGFDEEGQSDDLLKYHRWFRWWHASSPGRKPRSLRIGRFGGWRRFPVPRRLSLGLRKLPCVVEDSGPSQKCMD